MSHRGEVGVLRASKEQFLSTNENSGSLNEVSYSFARYTKFKSLNIIVKYVMNQILNL